MSRPLSPDVVSIQSQVVYGAVGNTAAAQVLQSHGLTVAQVPTIILSNTPHYPTIHGGAVPPEWFSGWLYSLFERDAVSGIRAVQIGYLGEPGQAEVLHAWLSRLLEVNPDVVVVMDPVLGDADKGIYTHPELVEGWLKLVTLASGLTPNAFELGVLTGMPVDTVSEVHAAASSLLHGRVHWVVATSAAPKVWQDGQMLSAVVTDAERNVVAHERVDSAVKGTGDMFSASITAELLAGAEPGQAVQRAGAAVTRALEDTLEAGVEELLLRSVHLHGSNS